MYQILDMDGLKFCEPPWHVNVYYRRIPARPSLSYEEHALRYLSNVFRTGAINSQRPKGCWSIECKAYYPRLLEG